MKPALNEHIKALYLIQYADAEFICSSNEDDIPDTRGRLNYVNLQPFKSDRHSETIIEVNGIEFYLNEDEISVSLRPLSDMTDEEIITLCSKVLPIAFQGNNPPKKWNVSINHIEHATVETKYNDYSFSVFLMTGEVDVYQGGELTNLANNHSGLDYLRSERFATEFMGYTVEELIEAGYCKVGKEASL